MTYDIIIPTAEKDYIKHKYVIDSIIKYLPTPDNIYVISKDLLSNETVHIHEDIALPFTKYQINKRIDRPSWIFQQLIKLCQDFTVNDNFLFIDSDLVFLKPVLLFEPNGKTIFYNNSRTQHHQPYFNFMKDVLNLDKVVNHTFIADFMMFNKNICKEIIGSPIEFFNTINESLTLKKYLLAEQEVYGNYCMTHFPDDFVIKPIKTEIYGIYADAAPYTEEYIEEIIKCNQNKNLDLITMHTWT